MTCRALRDLGRLTHARCKGLLNGKGARKLAHNTFLRADPHDTYTVVYHATDIIRFFPGGAIVVNSGGWHTPTTKERINALLGLGIRSVKHVWMYGPGKGKPWEDGINVGETESANDALIQAYFMGDKRAEELRRELGDIP